MEGLLLVAAGATLPLRSAGLSRGCDRGSGTAIDWLDLARYADTYGYQADVYRAMWPWRDWVVQALNTNLPYDQFVMWQLAGDLMPEPTRPQVLATAFNRHHRQTNEGGSIEEEFRVEYVADRTNTFATAFLGLTLECARCHSHKYDPITQTEYYQLFLKPSTAARSPTASSPKTRVMHPRGPSRSTDAWARRFA